MNIGGLGSAYIPQRIDTARPDTPTQEPDSTTQQAAVNSMFATSQSDNAEEMAFVRANQQRKGASDADEVEDKKSRRDFEKLMPQWAEKLVAKVSNEVSQAQMQQFIQQAGTAQDSNQLLRMLGQAFRDPEQMLAVLVSLMNSEYWQDPKKKDMVRDAMRKLLKKRGGDLRAAMASCEDAEEMSQSAGASASDLRGLYRKATSQNSTPQEIFSLLSGGVSEDREDVLFERMAFLEKSLGKDMHGEQGPSRSLGLLADTLKAVNLLQALKAIFDSFSGYSKEFAKKHEFDPFDKRLSLVNNILFYAGNTWPSDYTANNLVRSSVATYPFPYEIMMYVLKIMQSLPSGFFLDDERRHMAFETLLRCVAVLDAGQQEDEI